MTHLLFEISVFLHTVDCLQLCHRLSPLEHFSKCKNQAELVYQKKIFPGFMMPFGSKAYLTCLITCRPVSPTSLCRRSRLPIPIPCSPVHVPFSSKPSLQDANKHAFFYYILKLKLLTKKFNSHSDTTG